MSHAHSIMPDGAHQPPTPLFFEGRYRKMFPSQQLLAWQAYEQGLIEPLGLRCYCVLHEMAERRSYSDSPAHYRVPECHKLLDTTRRISEVEHTMDNLCNIGLVGRSLSALQFPTQPTAMPAIDLLRYQQRRAAVHPRRLWAPLARRMLKYLGIHGSPGLIATVFYASQRCLWDAIRGVCAGAIVARALADCFGFAERTARRHLSTLVDLGWLTPETRDRWYERKHGRWYTINPRWAAPKTPTPPPAPARPPRTRRPVQLPLPLREDTGHEASPPPAAAVPDTGEPHADRCEKVSGNGGMSCEILSATTPDSPSNAADSPPFPPPIPFQEVNLKHQTPAPQASPPYPDVQADPPPSPAVLTPNPGTTGVCIEEDKKPAAPTPPSDPYAIGEAVYAAMPHERQDALWAEVMASLLQQGYKRVFVTSQLILPEIYRLLAGQDLQADPDAPPGQAAGTTGGPTPRAPASQRTLPAPRLRHLLPEDLQETDRLLELYTQAREQGLIGTYDRDRREFFALAAHALRVGQENPCGLFVSLLHDVPMRIAVSDGDEDAARARLLAYDRPTPPPITGPTPPALSGDARFVDLARRVLQQDGWRDDPFIAVKRQYPEWTRARWDTACSELAQAQHHWKQVHALSRLTEVAIMEDWRVPPPDD